MKQFFFLFIIISLSFFTGCGNNSSEPAREMADFVEDQAFKDAHDIPRTTTLSDQGTLIRIPLAAGPEATGYAFMADSASQKYLFVIHEWWGLNDNIKEEAARLFKALDSVHVIALDLYDGQVATDPEQAGKLMQAVKEERAQAIVQGALDMAGPKAEIASIGWCFGGGWSLKTSVMAEERGVACVLYYGMPLQKADELSPLQAPILGVFAKKDGWITPEVADNFENLAKATGKSIEIHQFDAKHAFANPSNPDYKKEAAQKANTLTLNFLKKHLN